MATETYLTAEQVANRYNVNDKTPWKWASEGKNSFPKPVRLSSRTSRWKLAELEAWEAEKAERGAA